MKVTTNHGRSRFVLASLVSLSLAACGGASERPADLLKPSPTRPQADADSPVMRKLLSEPGVKSASPADIDVRALDAKRLRVQVPGGESLLIERGDIVRRGADDLSWTGRIGSSGHAQLVIRNGSITGTLTTDTETYQIRPIGPGRHVIVRLDSATMPPEHPPSFGAVSGAQPALRVGAQPRRTMDAASPTIEVLAAYTPAVLKARPDAEAMLQLAVDEANAANANSGVGMRFHLAHTMNTDYTESGDYDTDMARLKTPNDGFMDQLHVARDEYGADVVVLVFDNSAYCGLAGSILGDEKDAFALVHYTCATGYYSFAHEIGHLLGARHDVTTDSTMTPWTYEHGFQHASARAGDPPWRTIMAYNCSPSCNRLQYWSNPDITHNGFPMGTSKNEDNARVLNDTSPLVARFRTAPPPLACPSACGADCASCGRVFVDVDAFPFPDRSDPYKVSGGGTPTIDCGNTHDSSHSVCSAWFPIGSTVTLSMSGSASYSYYWEGITCSEGSSGPDNQCTFSVPKLAVVRTSAAK